MIGCDIIDVDSPWLKRSEIAEANPNKFRLDYAELESRKQFIRDTRAVVKVSCFSVCVCVSLSLFLSLSHTHTLTCTHPKPENHEFPEF